MKLYKRHGAVFLESGYTTEQIDEMTKEMLRMRNCLNCRHYERKMVFDLTTDGDGCDCKNLDGWQVCEE